MHPKEVRAHLNELGELGERVFELDRLQIEKTQELCGVLARELTLSEAVLSELKQADWPGKNTCLLDHREKLNIASRNSTRIIRLLETNVEITHAQVKLITESVRKARALADEGTDVELALILSTLGFAASALGVFVVAPPLAISGAIVGAASLGKSIHDHANRYQQLMQMQKQQIDDAEAVQLFEALKESLRTVEEALQAAVAPIATPEDFLVAVALRESRERWREQAGL